MQPAIDGGHEYLAFPDRDAAVDEVATGIPAHEIIGLGVIAPDFLAGCGVQRIDVSPGARCVQDSIDYRWRRFLAALGIAQVVAPRKTQLLDILGVDLRQRR